MLLMLTCDYICKQNELLQDTFTSAVAAVSHVWEQFNCPTKVSMFQCKLSLLVVDPFFVSLRSSQMWHQIVHPAIVSSKFCQTVQPSALLLTG